MEEAALGVGINSMPRGWTDRAQLPEEAQHCHCSQGCCLLPQPLQLEEVHRGCREGKKGVRANPAAPTWELRPHTGALALPGPQSLASFSPQQPVDSSLCLGKEIFLYKMWVGILSEKARNQSQACQLPLSALATVQRVHFSELLLPTQSCC